MKRTNSNLCITGVILSVGMFASMAINVNDSRTIKRLENHNIELEKSNTELNKENKSITKELEDKTNEFNNKTKEYKKQIEDLTNENKKLKEEKAKLRKFELTFYTDLPSANGGYTMTASQTKPRDGVIASNYYPFGTKIEINGKVYTVEDRGGKEFNSSNRLDVLIERNPGESDSQYHKRVHNMGRKQVVGKIL